MVDEEGWGKLRELAKNITIVDNGEFSKIQTAEILPDLSNKYVMDYAK